jgi:hypothetical protein
LRYPLDTEIPSPPNLVQSVIMVGAFIKRCKRTSPP